MAVAYVSTKSLTPTTGTGVASSSWALSGSNGVIVVHIALLHASATVSTLSWSLGSGTTGLVKAVRTGTCYVADWVIPAPTIGTGTFTPGLSVSVPYQITADFFTGADQTTPCPTGDAVSTGFTNETPAAAHSLSPTNVTANDGVAAMQGHISTGNENGFTAGTQTYVSNTTTINAQAGYRLGATPITVAAISASGSTNSMVAVRIVAAPSGGIPDVVMATRIAAR